MIRFPQNIGGSDERLVGRVVQQVRSAGDLRSGGLRCLDALSCKSIEGPTWAAWIQAIFSIIAILAAIGIAMWQRHVEYWMRHEKAEDQRKGRQSAAIIAMDGVIEVMQQIKGDCCSNAAFGSSGGSLHRLSVFRAGLVAVDLAKLSQNEATAVAGVSEACAATEAALLVPIEYDRDDYRRQIAGAINSPSQHGTECKTKI